VTGGAERFADRPGLSVEAVDELRPVAAVDEQLGLAEPRPRDVNVR
jgi:hypothetical protein